ncbi:hypothetical protein P154DRAFT_568773 [Amniculicola lignicola CBS 123094]|uniref:RING-type domain-containing protein n=1 Tax=Amniculicola lignicola CBS 123094 TaxID=1392246 RepID=A0A6A5X4Q9_9PLEO|nr:hypothetical protein P154DRAFT_568773 [Amniculicola lignicola CBS 123094]
MDHSVYLQGFSGNVITIKLANTTRTFTIHEDLLCSNSEYLKSKLQPNRKPIEGPCPICSIEFDPVMDTLTFCRKSCGANFHLSCMYSWRRNCPHCRDPWMPKHQGSIAAVPLDVRAMEVYLVWLYAKQDLRLEKRAEQDDDEYMVHLIQLLKVGLVLRDFAFYELLDTKIREVGTASTRIDSIRFFLTHFPTDKRLYDHYAHKVCRLSKTNPVEFKQYLSIVPFDFLEAMGRMVNIPEIETFSAGDGLREYLGANRLEEVGKLDPQIYPSLASLLQQRDLAR